MGLRSKIREQWERFVYPQLGLDTSKMILGYVLANITGDDENCFNWKRLPESNPENQAKAQFQLNSRMDWEISVPEIPEPIKTLLTQTREKIFQSPWKEISAFTSAKTTWFAMEAAIETIINESDKLSAAMIYQSFNDLKLHPYWQEFLTT